MGGWAIEPVRWRSGRLSVLDQRRLPVDEDWIELRGADDAIAAIRTLAVRGAPVIGIAAGYALALEAAGSGDLDEAASRLRAARPTAVNLAWAVDRVHAAARSGGAAAARAEAEAIEAEQDAATAAIGEHGADVLAGARRILTHCNAGALACAGEGGTALSVVLELARRGPVEVLVCETRPLLQGARLTCWELGRHGIPHALCVDGAAAGLIARGEVDAVVVGCDRVAANGDVANKVGTYGHALAARAAGIPFVVAGPVSTLDPATASGDAIAIEERDGAEVADAAPPGTRVRNPAFDVTPAALVSALVTERGVAAPPDGAAIAALLTPVPTP
jgi:methylthioribose-1-phosphate isomerase